MRSKSRWMTLREGPAMSDFIMVNGQRVETLPHEGQVLLNTQDIGHAVGYKKGWSQPFAERATKKIKNRAFISSENACEILRRATGHRRPLAFSAIEHIQTAFAEMPLETSVKSNGASSKTYASSESTLSQQIAKKLIDENEAIVQDVYKIALRIEEFKKWTDAVAHLLEKRDQAEMWFGTDRGIQ